MKKLKLEDNETKFWLGESSLQEEKSLKSETENPYFEALKQEGREKMDWGFEDFLQKVETTEETTNKVIRPNFNMRTFWWIAASISAVLVLLWITIPQKNTQPVVAYNTPAPIQNKKTDTLNKQPTFVNNSKINKNATVVTSSINASKSLGKRHQKVAAPTSNKTVVLETDSLGAYEPQFVLINGKPVHDENEAIKITKESLALLSDNINRGAQHLAVVKDLSIHL